jgi:hypothetical protein
VYGLSPDSRNLGLRDGVATSFWIELVGWLAALRMCVVGSGPGTSTLSTPLFRFQILKCTRKLDMVSFRCSDGFRYASLFWASACVARFWWANLLVSRSVYEVSQISYAGNDDLR